MGVVEFAPHSREWGELPLNFFSSALQCVCLPLHPAFPAKRAGKSQLVDGVDRGVSDCCYSHKAQNKGVGNNAPKQDNYGEGR